MGILVQREFTVDGDDRAEFERQSRLGVWENMRHNGAQMIAYGTWAFGGPGDVVVTNSVYADFDHWTATRPWGFFATSEGHIAETREIRAVFAGRARLIRHSRATIIDYDGEDSEPGPFFRNPGEPLAPLPPTFGRQSIVAETRWRLDPGDLDRFVELSREVVWAWLAGEGARNLVSGRDPLDGALVTMTAYRDVSGWHRLHQPGEDAPGDVRRAWEEREELVTASGTRLLMIATDYGERI